MVWSIFQHESNFINTTMEEINGIPCLKFKPKDHQGLLPTVIYYHGWHSSKEFKKFQAMAIAAFGFQVIVPDALYHGQRDAIDHDNPENFKRYLWEIILQSVKESKNFIDTIVNHHEADANRLAVMGSSMGAVTAAGVFVDNPNLKCLVGFNGSFAWQEAIKMNHLPNSSKNNEDIKFYDPMNNIDKVKERSILILHGADDTSLPIDSQKIFFDEFKPMYIKKPANIRIIEYPNVNHMITTGMIESAITLFKEQL